MTAAISNRLAGAPGALDLAASPPPASGPPPFAATEPMRFYPNGRAALAAILQGLALGPADEVLISGSFGGTYISSCVTCTVFNFCKPSRVLTDATRAILAIHEYGVPHPRLEELLAEARRRGIPLVEDCAHSLDTLQQGRPVGSRGDFALYSLPKVLPLESGGLLRGPGLARLAPGADFDGAQGLRESFRRLLPWIGELTRRRRENFAALAGALAPLPLLFPLAEGLSPFFCGLVTPLAQRIRQGAPEIVWGATERHDLLLAPTNPMLSPETLVAAVRGAFARCGA